MARRQIATLRTLRPVPPVWEIRLDLEYAPGAGTYVLADLGGPVRESLFPSVVYDTGFCTIVPRGHAVTHYLPGTAIDVIGPLGQGFRLSAVGCALDRLLLIAEAGDLPWLQPLYQAAPAVALVVEAGTRGQLPPPARFPPTLELTMVTRDGSTGYLGPFESDGPTPVGVERAFPRVRELVAWAECICVAGDMARYPALARLVQEVRFQPQPDFAQALVRVPMPCGVGVCDICRVTTRHGERRACVDGPVFDLMDFLE